MHNGERSEVRSTERGARAMEQARRRSRHAQKIRIARSVCCFLTLKKTQKRNNDYFHAQIIPDSFMDAQHRRFKKLMVANRGEIAIRVFRAATELGIPTVAVFTHEDRYALHRYKADESYQIGPDEEPLRPYLDVEELIRVAIAHDVDAIHPGYGFLSENAHFARRCRESGIQFIGPDPETMDQLGDKVAAKTLARSVGVPLIEDSREPLDNEEIVVREARRIGFPIMVKAAAGGGGRGMRVVRKEADLLAQWNEARSEARNAFGDDTVFLERFIDNPKHIEVQILGDQHGNIVHLFERDCSVQRRFQKVVEIAPSISIKAETKEKLYTYALLLTRAVNYSCAGTVEFLVDSDENIFFIEVNPRIQVEHTVTEEITGIDLVRSQILVASGLPLAHPAIFIRNQDDIKCEGYAIQCRITTEDPANEFKPDYGVLIHYRSPGGFGIRLDAGSAFTGARISPYFDSLLVKVTAWGRTFKGACERLQRALIEFRIRGVQTNIGFLENVIQHPDFQQGRVTVNFIGEHPKLLEMPRRRDRSTKMLRFLAEVIVNGNPDVNGIKTTKSFRKPIVPTADFSTALPRGSRDILLEKGPEGLMQWLRQQKAIQYTDTTLRDAHQSLLATRMRTHDMSLVAESYARNLGDKIFSIEMWGGATFDVAMRFLHECPWKRLEILREAIPNVLFQMLIRGSNGVGYKAYPDNLTERFIEEAGAKGMDIFRIFDSLNWVESMKTSIRAVRERTQSIAEVAVCYTGDITDPNRTKYNLDYYIDTARRIEDAGAHILCIKDMAGLLKPRAAEILIPALKEAVSLPIHLHTHDTAGIQSATYLKAVEANVDIIDLALASMSGLTSQPNLNSFVAAMQGHNRENPIELKTLNGFSNYFEAVREYYFPFESELRASTAEVYEHEIPGGQYSNLRPQARALGLEHKFEQVKANFKIVNQMLGDIVKVTPSSKVVGDMALFMTANNLTEADINERGQHIAFPDSFKELLRGDLGQTEGGFPPHLVEVVLKGEKPYTGSANEHLTPVNFEAEFAQFQQKFGTYTNFQDFLSYQLYPKVWQDFNAHFAQYDAVRNIPTLAFFYGLQPNQEIEIEIEKGKKLLIMYLNKTEPNEFGFRTVFFRLNGQTRNIEVRDKSIRTEIKTHAKASKPNEVGTPLQGSLAKILVKEGQEITAGTPLFTIEAMKMESTITSPTNGTVTKIHLAERTLVEQDDLIVSL